MVLGVLGLRGAALCIDGHALASATISEFQPDDLEDVDHDHEVAERVDAHLDQQRAGRWTTMASWVAAFGDGEGHGGA